jgi:hypothetical protein
VVKNLKFYDITNGLATVRRLGAGFFLSFNACMAEVFSCQRDAIVARAAMS